MMIPRPHAAPYGTDAMKHRLPKTAAAALLAAAALFALAPAPARAAVAKSSRQKASASRWNKLENCTLASGYMDGDSFHIKHENRDIIIRLYFVDCPETDDTHPERNADQADYFRIPMGQVIPVGRMGKKFTADLLNGEKFTVWTRWDDAMGSSAQKRYFGLVDVNGVDLGEALVEAGLARVYGAQCVMPDGRAVDQEIKILHQKESRAKSKRVGGWSKQARKGGASEGSGMFDAALDDWDGETVGDAAPDWFAELVDLKPYSDRWLNVPTVAFLRAETFINTEQFEDAEIEMRKLLKRFPDHPQKSRIEFYLALSCAMQERFTEAIRRFKTWLDVHPDDPMRADVQYWLPIAMYYGGHYEEALPLFEKYAKENPLTVYAPEAAYRATCCLYALEEFEKCADAVEKWLAQYPDHYFRYEGSIMLGDAYAALAGFQDTYDDALPIFDKAKTAYRRSMTPPAGAFYYMALTQIARIHKALAEPEEYRQMAREFEQYIRDMPNDSNIVDAGYNAGWAFRQLKRPQDAITLYWRMVELFGNTPAWEGFDLILADLAKLYPREDPEAYRKELSARYTKALTAQRLTLASRLAAEVVRAAADVDERQKGLASFSGRFSDDVLGPETLVFIGRAWIENGMPSAGIPRLERLLGAFPDSRHVPEAQMLLAQQALDHKQYDAAYGLANAVLQNAAEFDVFVESTFCRAEALRGLGRHGEAISDYNDVLANRAAPRLLKAEALLGIAECLEAQNEFNQAIAYYQRIYVLYKAYKHQTRIAYIRSGIDFERIGKKKEAAKTYQEFLDDRELSAGSAESIEAAQRLAALNP